IWFLTLLGAALAATAAWYWSARLEPPESEEDRPLPPLLYPVGGVVPDTPLAPRRLHLRRVIPAVAAFLAGGALMYGLLERGGQLAYVPALAAGELSPTPPIAAATPVDTMDAEQPSIARPPEIVLPEPSAVTERDAPGGRPAAAEAGPSQRNTGASAPDSQPRSGAAPPAAVERAADVGVPASDVRATPSTPPSTVSVAPGDSADAAATVSLRPFSGLHPGGTHTCFVGADGTAYCWGGNDRGQVGDGSRARRAAPVRVEVDASLARLDAGMMHTCAVDVTGRGWCWGANDDGQLGTGDTNVRTRP